MSIVEYSRALPRDTAKQRAAKSKVSNEAKRRLNNRSAKGKLAFLLAGNFCPQVDYLVTFTYQDSFLPSSRAEAKRNEQRFLRMLRTQRRRRGQDLKFISAIENKHGVGRWHHHMVINAADVTRDFDELCSLWTFGSVDVQILFDENHNESTWFSLARYLTKERPETGEDFTPVGARVFSCSHNLFRPMPKFEIVDISDHAELPENAELIEGLPQGESETYVDGIPVRIRYLCYQIRGPTTVE